MRIDYIQYWFKKAKENCINENWAGSIAFLNSIIKELDTI